MSATRLSRFRYDPMVARAVPFMLFIAMLVIASAFSSGSFAAESGDLGRWVVVSRGAIVALALVWFWPAYGELRGPIPMSPVRWLEALVVGVVVFVLWIFLDQDWAVLSRSPGFNPQGPNGATNWVIATLRWAGFALVVPVMEELFWRSFVLRWIDNHDFLSVPPRKVSPRAFIITTVLFALEHQQWLAGAIAGMAYNGLYMRSGNLWIPVFAHAVTNGVLGIWILYTQNWAFW